MESALRHAGSDSEAADFGALASQAGRLMEMVVRLAIKERGDDLVLLGAHLGGLARALGDAAAAEIAVREIYQQGRRDERADMAAARRHLAPVPPR